MEARQKLKQDPVSSRCVLYLRQLIPGGNSSKAWPGDRLDRLPDRGSSKVTRGLEDASLYGKQVSRISGM